jgi:hypothetical protein
MRNVSDKSCRENQNTHFVFSNFFFENRAVYEIIWKNMVHTGGSQMTIWRRRIACWIPTATNPHSEYVIRIAFRCKNGSTKARASMLGYTDIACLASRISSVIMALTL